MSSANSEHHGDSEIDYVGLREIWGGTQPFGLSPEDRRQHLYCIGKTGTGKSTLLRNLILQDIHAGRGVALIDPHGDLAEAVLDSIPRSRTEHVVYFNAADREHPIGFNLFESVPIERRHRLASGLVGAFRSLWSSSWGPRLEYILYASIAALLDCPNTSLLGVPRLLVDLKFRRWVVRQVKDPLVRSFWVDEFEQYDDRFLREAIAPIQNKIGQLLMSPPIRNSLGQVRRMIDPRFMMDTGRIFIANLAKGQLGEEQSNLLGSMLVTSFELAALARVDVPEAERRDFHLYIDEFHNFTTSSFATILSEARKYRLCLTLAHQYLEQIQPTVRAAVFGNVGTMISFRVGETDAVDLAQEYGKAYSAQEFSSLGNFEVVVKQLSIGRYVEPFKARTLAPLKFSTGRKQQIAQRSREKYGTPQQAVVAKIERWMKRRTW